jgi:hypothetical protein
MAQIEGKKHPNGVLITLGVLVMIAIVGWISSAVSKPSCQQQVGSWLFAHPIGGRCFYLLDADGDKNVRATFESIGATYSVVAPNTDDPRAWPRLSMKTHAVIPFLVSVDYFWEREAEIGAGATRWFFCLFGTAVEIGETRGYAT